MLPRWSFTSFSCFPERKKSWIRNGDDINFVSARRLVLVSPFCILFGQKHFLAKKPFSIHFGQKNFLYPFWPKKTFVSFLTNKDFSLLNKTEIQLPLIEILYECYFGQLGRCLVVSAKSGKQSVIGYPVASRPAGWIPTVGSRSRSAESLFFAPTGALVSKTPHYNRSDSTHFLRFSASLRHKSQTVTPNH